MYITVVSPTLPLPFISIQLSFLFRGVFYHRSCVIFIPLRSGTSHKLMSLHYSTERLYGSGPGLESASEFNTRFREVWELTSETSIEPRVNVKASAYCLSCHQSYAPAKGRAALRIKCRLLYIKGSKVALFTEY